MYIKELLGSWRRGRAFTLEAQSKQAFKAARTLITVESGLHLIAEICRKRLVASTFHAIDRFQKMQEQK